MTGKRCLSGCGGHMRLVERPRISEGSFEDINGRRFPRYRVYECEIGHTWTLDVYSGIAWEGRP